MTEPGSFRSWTEVAAFRRRNVLVTAPMTILAGLGAWIWLGTEFAAIWWTSVMLLFAIDQAICVWVSRLRTPRLMHEVMVGAFTFVLDIVYCILPLALMSRLEDRTGVVAGLSIIGAVALSTYREFILSRIIGLAGMAAVVLVTVLMVYWGDTQAPWPNQLFALLGTGAVYGYLLLHAIRHQSDDRGLRAALATATRREAAAEAATGAKSTLVATMSHEIRTPLNGVLGMVQVMESGPLVPAQRERLAIIRQSGEALTAILDDVLDLSRAETGKLELDIREFDLEEALEAACTPFLVRAEARGLTLRVDIEPDLHGRFLGDAGRVRQVIANLLRNALKFTEAGGITVSARAEGDLIHIDVADTGPTVPTDQADRMVRRFAQGEESTLRRGGGGLGMAVAWELCGLMGGRMGVENGPQGGAVYTVRLPLNRVRLSVAAEEAMADGEADWSNLRVLAADDDRVNRIVLESLLGQAGVKPVLVSDGGEALSAWAEAEWDLVLMDVHMRIVDGVSAVQEIRRHEQASGRGRTPVIALTGNAMAHQVAELLAAGMDGHVAKPIDAEQLFAAIRTALKPAS